VQVSDLYVITKQSWVWLSALKRTRCVDVDPDVNEIVTLFGHAAVVTRRACASDAVWWGGRARLLAPSGTRTNTHLPQTRYQPTHIPAQHTARAQRFDALKGRKCHNVRMHGPSTAAITCHLRGGRWPQRTQTDTTQHKHAERVYVCRESHVTPAAKMCLLGSCKAVCRQALLRVQPGARDPSMCACATHDNQILLPRAGWRQAATAAPTALVAASAAERIIGHSPHALRANPRSCRRDTLLERCWELAPSVAHQPTHGLASSRALRLPRTPRAKPLELRATTHDRCTASIAAGLHKHAGYGAD
jgi:hypothetical protein